MKRLNEQENNQPARWFYKKWNRHQSETLSHFITKGMLLLLGSYFFLFLVWPLLQLMYDAMVWEGILYLFLEDNIAHSAFLASIKIALITIVSSLCCALPLALCSTQFHYNKRELLSSLLVASLIAPPMVSTAGLKILLAQYGPINNWLLHQRLIEKRIIFLDGEWALIIMLTLRLFPLLYLYLRNTFLQIDPSLEEAAILLGIPAWRRYKDFIFPIAQSGIAAGVLLIFIKAFTDLGNPLMTNSRELLSIYLKDRHDLNPAYSNILLLVMILFMILFSFIFRYFSKKDRNHHSSNKGYSKRKLTRLAGLEKPMLYLVWLFALTMVYLPHLLTFLLSISKEWNATFLPLHYSLEAYPAALSGDTLHSLNNSIVFAFVSTILMGILGICAGYIIVRERGKIGYLVEAITTIPLLIPGLLMGAVYYAAYNGSWINPGWLLIISYTTRYSPYVVRSAVASFEQVHPSVEEASSCFGASKLQTILYVSLPIILPSILSSIFLAFSKSIFEVSSGLILATRERFYPLAKVMFDLCHAKGNGQARVAALGIIAFTMITLITYWAQQLQRRKETQIYPTIEQ